MAMADNRQPGKTGRTDKRTDKRSDKRTDKRTDRGTTDIRTIKGSDKRADRNPEWRNDKKPDRSTGRSASRIPDTYGNSGTKSPRKFERSPERKFERSPERKSSRYASDDFDRKGDRNDSTDKKWKRDRNLDNKTVKKTDKTSGRGKRSGSDKEMEKQQLDDLDRLEGRNSVLEALRSGRSINRILVSKGEKEGSVNQIIAMARQKHILIQEVDRSKLDTMSDTHAHQGVIAMTAAKDYVEVEHILEAAAKSGRPPFIIILDEITDAHNLGSILRTSNAAGVHGVIIPKRRAIGLTSVVSKASAGAIEYVPVARVTNIVQTIEYLKKQNIWVAGTDAAGEKSYYDTDLSGALALVIGSEGEGMGKLVREACDFVISIPMMGEISSLNAAVAGAIVLYEIVRQRSKK